MEVWKSQNINSCPIQWTRRKDELNRDGLKSSNKPDVVIKGRTVTQSNTFINDAASIWNVAPSVLKECKTIRAAKTQIKLYVHSLPI